VKEKAKRQLSSKEGDLRAAESMFQIPERKEQMDVYAKRT